MAANEALREHLVTNRLSGEVATTRGHAVANCHKLCAGDPEYTFGLSDWRTATVDETLDAVRALCGGDPTRGHPDGSGWIEPDSTLEAIEVHRKRLARIASAGGGRVLLATGHPTGLLPHYTALARALQAHGCVLLAPLDETWLDTDPGDGPGIRFLDGVGCVFDGGSLRHTHRSVYMEAMLDALGDHACDLVIADHGLAGAAIERGLPTLSIADVNDPAPMLAQRRGRTNAVLPIDDNLSPRLFVPVTEAMLAW